MTSNVALEPQKDIVDGAPWAFIAVMGVTGSGKSTFIKTVSGNEDIEIGHALESCTADLVGYSFHFRGYNVNLVDTPGFNDTFKSETEVLQLIADWLGGSYKSDTRLSGIIYLHSINNTRMEGSALRNFKMFRQLCGNDPLKNIVLATTFWEIGDEQKSLDREKELSTREDFWGDMLAKGSAIKRVKDRNSALDIVSGLLGKSPKALKIQRELVEEEKHLVDTAAGQVVNEELVRLEQKYKEDLERMQQQMDEVREHDNELREILEKEQKKLSKDLDRLQKQQEQLKYDRRAEKRKMENEFETRLADMQLEMAQHQSQQLKVGDVSFEQATALMRANESKIRTEEREELEKKIAELTKKNKAVKKKSGGKRKMTAKVLVKALQVILPATTIALLGFPIPFPVSSSMFQGSGSSSDDLAGLSD
ncbi:MAG: hypothetical protein M1822_008373 [Bathelium mastoideum]|nr:MAG: hypothetical protein M1822_008373 [Bathelium mastoideum]